ncbi:MAG: type IX secretion system membrane protein PorP/SprF [Flavobacteriales bacterium]
MKHIKWCMILLICGVFGLSAYAQQVGRYSMYMQNFYAINPAAAGLEDHLDATIGYRKQWLGIDNSPQMYFVSANMPLGRQFQSPQMGSARTSDPSQYMKQFPIQRKSKHGVGAMINVNQYGAFKYTQAYGTYAYHLPITSRMNLSFGANVGINSQAIDQGLIDLEIPDDNFYDQVIADAQQNSTLLDMDIGLMLYARPFFIGYSSEQLLGNHVSFGGSTNYGKLLVHHKLLFGKTFKVNRQWSILPNGFVTATMEGIISTELNVRVDYKDQLWGGLSYRNKDAIIPMFGMYINDQFKLGYAYDITISQLRAYSPGGSHEIMLGIMFGNKRAVF